MRLARCQLVERLSNRFTTKAGHVHRVLRFGFHDGQGFVNLPGCVQIVGEEAFTVSEQGYSVRGYDKGWLIVKAGHELITDDQYWHERHEEIGEKSRIDTEIAHHLMELED